MPERAYNREKAVAYAHKWAYGRNPEYYNFDPLGGDCTNFASQVIFAGAGVMNYIPTFGWYYINLNRRAPAWTGVEYLYRFLIRNTAGGPSGTETQVENVKVGDIVQISFDGKIFAHTPVIIETGTVPSAENILVAAHTYDTDYKPLSEYSYSKLRFIHIDGVRL